MKMYNTRGALITSNEGNLRSYDTGWIACSDWTNQHLGSALGGNVIHNLNTPLRNLMVKVFISTDATDANSFEIPFADYNADAAGTVNLGLTIFQVTDDNNLIIQTGSQGFGMVTNADGTITFINSDSYYYRIVVYEMTSVYSGVHMEMYETPWINRSDWTNVHMGSTITKNVDSNVVHNLNAPLSDLLVKILISTDGTDDNSFEAKYVNVVPANASDITFGILLSQVDSDTLLLQTGTIGIQTLAVNGEYIAINNEDWYYKIKVYKLTAQPPVIVKSCVSAYSSVITTLTNANTDYLIDINTVEIDTLGEWDITAHSFTPKESGRYLIAVTGNFNVGANADRLRVDILVDGASVNNVAHTTVPGSAVATTQSYSRIIYISAGQVLTTVARNVDSAGDTMAGQIDITKL